MLASRPFLVVGILWVLEFLESLAVLCLVL
jgi:hypothetical protein